MKIIGLACSLMFAVGAIVPANAATYSNSFDDVIFSFGTPDTTTYGQTFVAPGGSLESWTFYSSSAVSDGARLVVALWGGTGVVGGELFGSLSQTVTSAGLFYAHTFSSINLNLTPGLTYISYLTVAGVANPVSDVEFTGSNSSPLGGLFVYNNSDGVDPLSNNDGWYFGGWNPPHLQYTAVFNETSETPLPAAVWLFGSILAGYAGVSRWRKRKQETDAIAA